MTTKRPHNFSAAKTIINLLKLVGAGLKCPPADRKQKLEIRRQMRYGQGFSKVTASQKQFVCSRRGGSLCPPEQSAERKDFMSVMKPELLSFAVTNYKIKLSCGRAQRPAPTTTDFIFSEQPQLCMKPACTASDF